ncbi:MAG: hypothetical protein OXR67_06100 [Chloroflexota bacterium]|nr:hypothetical protein [Chloroflexota bacterium]
MRNERPATIAASTAHVLAWIAFLWLAFWPYAYQGVSATPVQVDELGNPVGEIEAEIVRESASLVEVNGVGVLIPLFIPAAVTGLTLMMPLAWRNGGVRRTILFWMLTTALLGFCVLGYLSFGLMYAPAAVALAVATVLQSLGRHRRT